MAPFSLSGSELPAAIVTAPVVRTPGELPVVMAPPAATTIEPLTDPVPASVAPLATVTALDALVDPVMRSVPALTVVAPV